ncbi:MAG TPA: hypothetical protein VKM55_24575 [Candidatus Lokiarchaeia archaeon]|nr:hypothetical protein [Candidatus Lokiarchaeia archaeon]
MVTCHELKAGDMLRCNECGLEITVSKGCDTCGEACEETGACSEDEFKCCGKPLELISE